MLRTVAVGISEVVAVLLLGGCGFRPLYARRSRGGATELAQIRIDPIGNRIGQVLRNVLLDRMTPNGVPKVPRYVLSVKLDPSTQYLNFRKDNTASRADLWVSAVYKLQDLGSNEQKTVFNDIVRAVASYDVLDAPYATVVAAQEAQQRVAHQLAEKILDRVVVHFLGTSSTIPDRSHRIVPKATERP